MASVIALMAAAPLADAAFAQAANSSPAVLGFQLRTGARLSFGINQLPTPTIRDIPGGAEIRFVGVGPMQLAGLPKMRQVAGLEQRTEGNVTVLTIRYTCACKISTSRAGRSFRVTLLERPGQVAPPAPDETASAKEEAASTPPKTAGAAGSQAFDSAALRIDLTEKLMQLNSLAASPPLAMPAPAMVEAAPPVRKTCPPAFSMDGWKGQGPFAARLLALRTAAARAEEAAPEMAALAEFHLGHGLAAEALAITHQARVEWASDAERVRLARVADLSRLLKGVAIDTRSPLLTDPPDCDRADTPLWRALSAAATGDAEVLTQQLEAARPALSQLPEPLLQMFASRIVEAVPDDAAVLRGVAAAMRNADMGGPEEAASRYLLQARIARTRGDAIDEAIFLERAAHGVSMPALTARLRLAELRAANDDAVGEHSARVLADAARTYRDTQLGQSAAHHLSERQLRRGDFAAALRTADENGSQRLARRGESRGATQAARVLRTLLVDPARPDLPTAEERLVLYWKYHAYATPGERGDDIRLGAARLMLAQGLPEAALDVVRHLSEPAARSRQGILLRATAEARAGDPALAATLAARLEDGDEHRRIAAEALARSGRLADAAQKLEGVTALPDQTRRAAWFFEAREWPAAAEAFAAVLRNAELTPALRATAGDHYAVALALAGQEPAEDLRGLAGLAKHVLGALSPPSPDPDAVAALRGAVRRAGEIESLLPPADGAQGKPGNGRRGT
jgi:hypothetical protein